MPIYYMVCCVEEFGNDEGPMIIISITEDEELALTIYKDIESHIKNKTLKFSKYKNLFPYENYSLTLKTELYEDGVFVKNL